MEEKEIWKDIVGYEGYYMVSNLGRVKSVERVKWNGRGYYKTPEIILKPGKNRYGYLYVILYKDGKAKFYRVHQLVGKAFLSNPQGYKELNHIDEDKTNNRVENLEWCSTSYNINYGTRNERVAEKLKGRKQTEEHIKKRAEKHRKPIYSINKVSGLIMYWNSAAEAGKALGINFRNISACCKGRQKSAGGFYWMFVNNNDDDTE